MNYDYAIHSDFLIYWTGKDIDALYDKQWYEIDKSKTSKNCNDEYIKRIYNILTYGLWMTEEPEEKLTFGEASLSVPAMPRVCFTELKLSESRTHAKQYGRLGIGVKRPFVFTRYGRPLVYYGFNKDLNRDKFLRACAEELKDNKLLNFFKPMNSSSTLNYDFYRESEWRIIYFEELLSSRLIINPREPKNVAEYKYFCSLSKPEQDKLKYLIPLDGWFAMIIYPSLEVKNIVQYDMPKNGIKAQIGSIKGRDDHGNRVEVSNWPIEIDLDACRNF